MSLEAKNESAGESQNHFNCSIEWVNQQACLGGHYLQLGVAIQPPSNEDMSMEAKESPQLAATTRQRLAKT
jgi:hypothetical protein